MSQAHADPNGERWWQQAQDNLWMPYSPLGLALEVCGSERLMFGSDWPVAILAGDYAKAWAETGKALDSVGVVAADRASILGNNAAVLYSIGDAA